MKDISNRHKISLAEKVSLAKLACSQNGIRLSLIESVDEWRDEGELFNLDAFADRVTVFAKPIAA